METSNLNTWEPTDPLRRTTPGYHPSSSIPCESPRAAETPRPPRNAFRYGNEPQFRASCRVRWRVWKDRRVESGDRRGCKSDIRAVRAHLEYTDHRRDRVVPSNRVA